MHELSVSAALLEQVAGLMERHGAARVKRITLRLGALSGVEPALLQAAYAQARVHTFAESADLVIVGVPLRIVCAACGAEGNATPNCLTCPACNSARTRILSGDEMLLEAIDLVF